MASKRHQRAKQAVQPRTWDHGFDPSCMCPYCSQLRKAYEEQFPDLWACKQDEVERGHDNDDDMADLVDTYNSKEPT